MRIAVIVAEIGPSAGGLYYSVRALSIGAAAAGDTVEVFSMGEYSDQVFEHWLPIIPKTFPIVGPKAYRYAPGMCAAVEAFEPDIIHLHGLWLYSSRVALHVALKLKCPLVLSPRGMLDIWALRNSALKKKLMSIFQENRVLRQVDCFHALNRSEMDSIRSLGYSQPICILPNGIDLPELLDQAARTKSAAKKQLIFIGRIHPKKGIVNLLQAWARVMHQQPEATKEWELSIYGWDDGNHLEGYQKLAEELSVSNSVFWPGSVYGNEKVAVLENADAFILPSFSEGLPMALIEAWAYRIPVLMTHACNIPEGFSSEAAIEMATSVDGTEQGLRQLFQMSDEDRREMGQRGRKLVEFQFTWGQQVKRLQSIYQLLQKEGLKPNEFVNII